MKIRLSEPLSSGAPFAGPVIVRALRSRPRDSDDAYALTVLGVTVGIDVEIGAPVGQPVDGVEITLHAREARHAFPVFRGTLRVEPVDTFTSRLTLAGQYHVPLGAIGAAADRTVLAGAARRSLRELLNEVRRDVEAAVIAGIAG